MSNKLDERITRIRFDNDQFERGVATSMQSLDRLKNKLESTESVDAFSGITKSAEKTDLSGLAKAIDGISDKFSALRMIAINVLSDIATQAINTGVALVKNLSTDNIAAGWGKYEQEVQAVQTIMVTLDDEPIENVEEKLKKIGWYSDETSYSYEEMVGSMSKIISSGVGLDDATNAVIGLANAAAAAGVSTKKAQQAFYNFSQAFGAGYMQLQDWRSIELLNMATPEFKENILKTAASMGKIVEVGQGVYATFDDINNEDAWFTSKNMRNSLKDKWFDTDVMTRVLNMYGEFADQVYEVQNSNLALEEGLGTASKVIEYLDKMGLSVDNVSHKAFLAAQEAKTFTEAIDSVKDAVSTKWKDTFKEIFGNYDEARKLWSAFANKLYDLFALGGDERNDLLALWNDPNYLFEQMLPDERLRASYKFPEIKKGRDVLIQGLWNIYDSVVNVVNVIKSAWNDVFPQMTAFKLYEITRKFRDITAKIKKSTEDLSGVKEFFKGIFSVFRGALNLGKKALGIVKQLFPVFSKLWEIIKSVGSQMIQFAKDALSYFKLTDKFGKAATKIESIFKKIKDAILGLDASSIKLPTFEEFINAVQRFKENIGDIKTYVTNAIKWIGRLFNKYVPEDEIQELVTYTDSISGSTRIISDLINPELDNTRSNFQKTWSVISNVFKKIKTAFEKVSGWLSKVFKDYDLKDALGTGVIGVLSWFTIKLGRTTETVGSVLGTLGEAISGGVKTITESIGSVFYGVSNIANAYAKNLKADTITTYIKSIAFSILAIVAALYLFSKIDDKDGKLEESIKVIGKIGIALASLCIVLAAVEAILNRTSKSQNFTGFSVKGIQIGGGTKKQGILGIIAGILGMVYAVKLIGNIALQEGMTKERLNQISNIVIGFAWTLTACIIALSAFSAMTSKISVKKNSTSFLAPVSLAYSMLIMIKVFQKLDTMKVENTKKVVLGLLGILATLGLFSLALGRIDAGVGIGLLGIAASILLFLEALKQIDTAHINLEGKGGYIAIFFGILVVLGLISIFSKKAIILDKEKQKLKNVGTNMLSIILGLVACVGAIYLLSKIEKEELKRGALATIGILVVLFGGLSTLLAIVSHQGQYAGKGLIGVSLLLAIVTIMVAVFTILARFDPKALSYAVLSVSLIAVAVGAMLTPLIWIKQKSKGLGGVIAIILLLLATVTAFYIFAKSDAKKLQQAVVSVGVLALALGTSCWLISRASSSSIISEGHHILALVYGLLIALTTVVVVLSMFVKDAGKALTGAEAISLMAIAISVACLALSAMPIINWGQVGRSLTMFGSVSVLLGLIVAGLSWIVNGENLEWLKTYGLQLLALIGALTVMSFLMGFIGKIFDGKAALEGAKVMLIVAGALLLIGVALGAVSYGLKKLFESQGLDIMDELQDLIDITYAIGSLVNALVTGVTLGALPNVGQTLSDFSDTVQPFIDFASNIPEEFGTGMSSFATGFAKFTSAGFWYNIKDWFDKGDLFQNTIEVITNASEPLGKMVAALSQIDDVTKADAAIDFISKLGPAITGINDSHINRLEKDVYPVLTELSEHILEFGNSLIAIDDTTVEKIGWAATALNGIGDAAHSFYNEYGGLLQLGEIGNEVEILGDGIESYLESIDSISEDGITKTNYLTTMLLKLLEINNVVGKNQGAVSWFAGWTDLGKFGEELGKFVKKGLNEYLGSIETLTVEYLTKSKDKTPLVTEMMSELASLGRIIEDNKGLWPSLAGKTDIGDFGEQLPRLADGINAYAEKLIYTPNDLERTVGTTNAIADALINLTTAEKISKMQDFMAALKTLATDSIDDFKTVFVSEETKEKIYTSVATMVGYVKASSDSIAQDNDFISQVFKLLFDAFGIAITNGFDGLKTSSSTLTKNVLDGVIEGIDTGTETVVKAWEKMNETVDKRGKLFWETKSPSKRTYKLGLYIDQGLANGIKDGTSLAKTAYEEFNGEVSNEEDTFEDTLSDLYDTAKDTISEFSDDIKETNGDAIDSIKQFFSNLKSGISDYGTDGLAWVKEKFDEFLSQYGASFDGTNWMSLVFGSGGNPLEGLTDSYYDQLQSEFEQWLSDNHYEMDITPVFTDENGNPVDLTDYSSMLSGSYGGTVAGYSAEDVQNLTKEIYHLEDALYSLKNAMQDQKVVHSGELTIRYSNESDFIDRIQNAVIGDIRRGIRS